MSTKPGELQVDAWRPATLPPKETETEEEWFERIKKQIKAKILESYRNGQKARQRAGQDHGQKSASEIPFFLEEEPIIRSNNQQRHEQLR